jgi:hypothetical protein
VQVGQVDGIWGGTTERERCAARRPRTLRVQSRTSDL